MPRGNEKFKPVLKFALVVDPDGKEPDIEVFDTLKERCAYVNVLRSIDTPYILFPSPAVSFEMANYEELA
jgi:hypothetical protein